MFANLNFCLSFIRFSPHSVIFLLSFPVTSSIFYVESSWGITPQDGQGAARLIWQQPGKSLVSERNQQWVRLLNQMSWVFGKVSGEQEFLRLRGMDLGIWNNRWAWLPHHDAGSNLWAIERGRLMNRTASCACCILNLWSHDHGTRMLQWAFWYRAPFPTSSTLGWISKRHFGSMSLQT